MRNRLAPDRPGGGHGWRGVAAIIVAYALAASAFLPVASQPGPKIPGMTAAFVATLFATELATSFLLFVRFRHARTWSLLLLACAYLFAGLMAVPHLLTFPGAILEAGPLLGVSLQSAAWLFVLWLLGFAALTLGAVVLEVGRRVPPTVPFPVGTMIPAGVAVVAGTVAAVVLMAIHLAESLPTMMDAGAWTPLNQTANHVTLAMLAASVGLILWAKRDTHDAFLWLALALTAVFFANVLGSAGGGRYTVGWSVSRVSWIIAACTLFLFFMWQFARQQEMLAHAKETLERRVAERTDDLKEANARLRSSLSQRDYLLREVYHRVKNNMQVVDSLLQIQAARLEGADAKEALTDLRRRVYTLGLVHQQLMHSEDLATFDIRPFLEELCNNLAVAIDAEARGVRMTLDIASLKTGLDLAIPLGLLTTELFTNAIKHGIHPQEGGTVTVTFVRRLSDTLCLTVRNKGQRGAEILSATGQGSLITRALASQLGGTITVTHDDDETAVEVMVPFPAEEAV